MYYYYYINYYSSLSLAGHSPAAPRSPRPPHPRLCSARSTPHRTSGPPGVRVRVRVAPPPSPPATTTPTTPTRPRSESARRPARTDRTRLVPADTARAAHPDRVRVRVRVCASVRVVAVRRPRCAWSTFGARASPHRFLENAPENVTTRVALAAFAAARRRRRGCGGADILA